MQQQRTDLHTLQSEIFKAGGKKGKKLQFKVGDVICSDCIPLNEFVPDRFYIMGSYVTRLTKCDSDRVKDCLGLYQKSSIFYACRVHSETEADTCTNHHFDLIVHEDRNSMNLSGVFEARLLKQAWDFSADRVDACFYVIFDPEKTRWGYGITKTNNRLAEYRKDSPYITLWKYWRTTWPPGMIEAFELSVRNRLTMFSKRFLRVKNVEWYYGEAEALDGTIQELMAHFQDLAGGGVTVVLPSVFQRKRKIASPE